MQVNITNDKCNIGFQAMYVNKKRSLCRGANWHYSELINFIKPNVEQLADNVDIYIKPKKFSNLGIDIIVSKVTKSPLKRLFGLIGYNVKQEIWPDEILQNDSKADLIIDRIKYAKQEYSRYKDYENQTW